jgi:hypothetical protein
LGACPREINADLLGEKNTEVRDRVAALSLELGSSILAMLDKMINDPASSTIVAAGI